MITWTTPGNLGSSTEGAALTIQLAATNNVGGTVYNLICGQLPVGMILTSTGLLVGTPLGNAAYKFVVRASSAVTGDNSVTDQTFSLSIIGHAPVVGSTIALPDQFDISEYSYQVVASDVDIQDSLTYRIVSGALPNNLIINKTGLISGIIAQQLPQRFEFVIAVNDGTYTVNQRLILNVKNRAAGTVVKPLLLNRNSNIGTFKLEDQFSYKIDGSSDGITINKSLTYSISSGTLPPGLVLRTDSGWIDGFLSKTNYPSSDKITYTFTVVVHNGAVDSDPKTFTITIDPIPVTTNSLTWNVGRDLGTITLGSYSRFDISPHNDATTTFRIKPTKNLITSNSDAFNGGSWVGYCAGNMANVTYNTTDIAAPNGTFTATKIVRDSNSGCGSGSAWGMVWGLGNVTVGRTYTISMWVYAPTIINGCTFGFNDNWGRSFNITKSWTRVTYTGTLTDPGNGIRGFQFIMPAGSGTAYFWGAQLEANSFATAYASLPPGPLDSPLPPNLRLQPEGLIVGRVGFLRNQSGSINQIETYVFTVEMVDAVNNVVAEKEFTVRTLYQAPYETVYLQTFPRTNQRDRIVDLLTDVSVVPPSLVFRPTDENFGVVFNFKMLFASGLTATAAERYVAAMVKNHQRKVAYIQEFKLAVAKDSTTNLPVYEVVYAVLVDTDQMAPNVVKLRIPNRPKLKVNNTQINASYASLINADQATVTRVFPGSFNIMRQNTVNAIMAVSSGVLPEWMTTVQDDGTTIDYANVLPLVYVKVGQGAKVLSNIKASKELFNTVPFDIDGYVWESYQQPAVIGANEIATSGITTKYLAFPRTGISNYSR
jgi:hypothetical protein